MPILTLKALECSSTEDWTKSDSARLEIMVDGGNPNILKRDIATGVRWLLEIDIPFRKQVVIKLYDEDWPDNDDFLGQVKIGETAIQRGLQTFEKDDANYKLWYEVRPINVNSIAFHRPNVISLRAMLGRMGRGVLSTLKQEELTAGAVIYRASEAISVREVMQQHDAQDGQRGPRESIKSWVLNHCNPFGEESVIPINRIPKAFSKWDILTGSPNWSAVRDERSYRVEGYQHYSRHSDEDYMARHGTMDWNWDLMPDPQFMYMVNYTTKSHPLTDDTTKSQPQTKFTSYPFIECEWETGVMPLQWRPFWGEHVTVVGRHIFDRGHMSVTTEIHPVHTIVRHHTTAGPLGDRGTLVPVNRAIIGMGTHGGFPSQIGSRWRDETGSDLPEEFNIPPFTNFGNVWITDLRKHPLRFKLFPPAPKPSATAELRAHIVLAQIVSGKDWVEALLSLRENWDKMASQNAPATLQPKFTLREQGYFDVTVDLSTSTHIPAAYYAIVECGWSERGSHTITQWDVNFSQLNVEEVSDQLNGDWRLFYGVNGEWKKVPFSDNSVQRGEVFSLNSRFRVYTVDDQPLLLRDAGMDMNPNWGGYITVGDYLDRIEINAFAPNYFGSIAAHQGVSVTHQTSNEQTIKVQAWKMALAGVKSTEDKHEWTIVLKQTSV